MTTIDQKKAELEQKQKQSQHLDSFRETYQAFLDTLVEIYPSIEELNEWRAEFIDMTTDQVRSLALGWTLQLSPYSAQVKNSEPMIFMKNIPCLMKTTVPQLWVQDKLTTNSKKYVWAYIVSLLENAEAATIQNTGEKTGDSSGKSKDIRPLSDNINPENIPGIGDLYKQLPVSMINKVKKIADKYSNQVENGHTKLEDLKFNEISEELFQEINADEMQEVVKSVSGLLQGVLSGSNSNDLSRLFGSVGGNA